MSRHHAYLIVGEKSDGERQALALFELGDTPVVGDPDVQILSFSTFGIDDARMIERWAVQAPVARDARSFIISFSDITHETQNALLKLFEEPPGRSRFAMIANREDRILPTLRSRFEVIRLERGTGLVAEAEAFLKQTPGERMTLIAGMLKEERPAALEGFVDALENVLAKKKDRDSMRAILLLRKYMGRRGASPKMLLEHLSLSLP